MEFKKIETNRTFADWESGNTWIEVKINLRAVYDLRNAFFQSAFAVIENPERQMFLLLIEPKISYDRLHEEWAKAKMAFRPEVMERLSVAIFQDNQLYGIPEDFNSDLSYALIEICEQELAEKKNPLPQPDYKAEIFKVLIYKWLMKNGPMTSEWLSQTVGCTYRTVANALESFGNALVRHSDRSVELKYFPKEAWEWLVINGDKSRLTRRYSDRSGNPRSIDSLLKRLGKTGRDNIAVAGTLGANHHYPDIDLVGIPRLDLTVHFPDKYLNIDFIEKLDPALKEETDKNAPASVVLHFIRRKKSFFTANPDGIAWADPVECLLDLHEMRLEPQALDFINYLQNKGEHK